MTALMTTASSWAPIVRARVEQAADTVAVAAKRLMLDRQIDFWLGEVDATWSLSERRARVVEVIDETPDMKTFVLTRGRRWPAHRAGQYVPVDVEIDGVRERRCYSISSAPSDATLAITVKRTPGGRVSNHLFDRVAPGAIVFLGDPAGDFVVDRANLPLLLLSGGSGVTPLMSIVRDLAVRGELHDVVFLHCARSLADVPFRDELEDLASANPDLRVELRVDDRTDGPLSTEELLRTVPDFASRETFLCGPTGMMDAMDRVWDAAGARARLHHERFVARAAVTVTPGDGQLVTISLARSKREVTAGSRSLLEELEAQGERPAHGCRIGICQTCKCRKRKGAVVNLLTGEVSSNPDEEIQLCISAARSDVELDA